MVWGGTLGDFWLRVSKVSVHHGRDHVAEQNSSHHGKTKAALLAFFLLFYSTRGPNPWDDATTFKVSLFLTLLS